MYGASRMYEGLSRLKAAGFAPRSILDIGAHDGAWARGARALFPDAFIMMVEALPDREENLRRTLEEIGNADYRIALLGQAPVEKADFFVVSTDEGHTGSSRYVENTNFDKELRRMPQTTLDLLLAEGGRAFDFAKLDVQGSELDVLAGFAQGRKALEAVLMEVSVAAYNLGAPRVDQVLATMALDGFTLFDIVDEFRQPNERRYLVQFDGVFLREGSPLLPDGPL